MEMKQTGMGETKLWWHSSAPSTRLSASALPFTLNRSDDHQPCESSLDSDLSGSGYYDFGYYDDQIEPEYSYIDQSQYSIDEGSGRATKMSASHCDSTILYGRSYIQLDDNSNKLKDSSSAASSSSSDSILSCVLSKDEDSNCYVAVNEKAKLFDSKPSSLKEPYVLLNVEDDKVFQDDEVLVEKCNEQIVYSGALHDVATKPHNSETTIEDENSSSDTNDTDVDSPCWRGLASTQYAFERSKFEDLQQGIEISQAKEACSTLNPWAQQFVPGNASKVLEEGSLDGSVDVDSPLPKINLEKELTWNRISSSRSQLDSSLVRRALLSENYFILDCHTEESKPSFPSLKVEAKTEVRTMHNVSEMVLKSCSNNLSYLNEHEYELIECTIDKLNAIIRRRDLLHPSNSNYQKDTSDFLQRPNTDAQMIRKKKMLYFQEHELFYQVPVSSGNNFASSLMESFLESFHPNDEEDIIKGNDDIAQIANPLLYPMTFSLAKSPCYTGSGAG